MGCAAFSQLIMIGWQQSCRLRDDAWRADRFDECAFLQGSFSSSGVVVAVRAGVEMEEMSVMQRTARCRRSRHEVKQPSR
jgi:hypothetical protein